MSQLQAPGPPGQAGVDQPAAAGTQRGAARRLARELRRADAGDRRQLRRHVARDPATPACGSVARQETCRPRPPPCSPAAGKCQRICFYLEAPSRRLTNLQSIEAVAVSRSVSRISVAVVRWRGASVRQGPAATSAGRESCGTWLVCGVVLAPMRLAIARSRSGEAKGYRVGRGRIQRADRVSSLRSRCAAAVDEAGFWPVMSRPSATT